MATRGTDMVLGVIDSQHDLSDEILFLREGRATSTGARRRVSVGSLPTSLYLLVTPFGE